jgi:hypothetical protein
MSTLDYIELPALLNDMSAQILEKISEVERKLEDKARFIASKSKSEVDHNSFLRLKEEQKHIIQVAEVIDLIKKMMAFFERMVNATNADFWLKARDGGELAEKIKFMQDTIATLSQREGLYLEMLKERNGINKQQTNQNFK